MIGEIRSLLVNTWKCSSFSLVYLTSFTKLSWLKAIKFSWHFSMESVCNFFTLTQVQQMTFTIKMVPSTNHLIDCLHFLVSTLYLWFWIDWMVSDFFVVANCLLLLLLLFKCKLKRVIWVQKHHKSNVIVEEQYKKRKKMIFSHWKHVFTMYGTRNWSTFIEIKSVGSMYMHIKMYFFIQSVLFFMIQMPK